MDLREQFRAFREEFHRLKLDQKLQIALTASIVILAIAQWYTTVTNNESTGQQTNDLIAAGRLNAYAATQNAETSRNFAQSAASINQGVADAVSQLAVQARASQTFAASAAAQAVTSRDLALNARQQNKVLSDQLNLSTRTQRPWVGVDSIEWASPVRYVDLRRRHTASVAVNPNNINWNLDFHDVAFVKNHGASPAFSVQATFDFRSAVQHQELKDFLSKPQIPCDPPDPEPRAGDVLYPDSVPLRNEQQTIFSFSGSDFSNVQTLWIVACVLYKDSAGAPHETKTWFRAEIPPSSQWQATSDADVRLVPMPVLQMTGQEAD